MNEPQITLSLPLSVVEYLLALVNEQPRKTADPVFRLIQTQAQAALNPPPAPAPEAADEKPGLTN
jgi:hypothetical protein